VTFRESGRHRGPEKARRQAKTRKGRTTETRKTRACWTRSRTRSWEKKSGGEKKPIDLAADRRAADVRDERTSPPREQG
jgi:hypothetical protein